MDAHVRGAVRMVASQRLRRCGGALRPTCPLKVVNPVNQGIGRNSLVDARNEGVPERLEDGTMRAAPLFPVGMLLLVLPSAPRSTAAVDLEAALLYAESLKGAPYGWWSGGAIPAAGAVYPGCNLLKIDVARAGLGIERPSTSRSHCGGNELLLRGDPKSHAAESR